VRQHDVISADQASEVLLVPFEQAVAIYGLNDVEDLELGLCLVLHQDSAHDGKSFFDFWCPLVKDFVDSEVLFVDWLELIKLTPQLDIVVKIKYSLHERAHETRITHLPYCDWSRLQELLYPVLCLLVKQLWS
jgi:hypothetical protein